MSKIYQTIIFGLAISIITLSCNKDDNENLSQENNTTLPNSIIFKNIPSGTFLMGGTTIHNDAPIVSVTLSAFQISQKEITNNEYIDFLNSAYSNNWLTVSAKQVNDPCGSLGVGK